MNFILVRYPQTIIFFALALLTLLIISFVLLTAFTHVNVLHMILSLTGIPDILSRWP